MSKNIGDRIRNIRERKHLTQMDVYVKYTEDAGKEGAERLSEYFSN